MTVYDLGTIDNNTARSRWNETVTNAAPNDIFKFRTLNSRSINVMISDLQGGDADLQLYRDTNGNGTLQIGTDQLMQSSTNGGTNDDIINRWRGAGTYFAYVYQFSGSPITYDIYVSATKQSSGNLTGPPNLLARENDLGYLGGNSYYSGSVGTTSVSSSDANDTSDIYSFYLDAGQTADFYLYGLSSNADIRVIQDDGGRTAGAGETIATSNATGTNYEYLPFTAPNSGDYYLQVYTPGLTNTNYNLDIYA
jgi:hypothetical protein